jgi:two-component system cell cycle sensor histidine kinase/response regulator CckA
MPENPELRPSNPNQKVILIAEDDVVVRSIAQFVLEAAGYIVLTANNAADALNISRQYLGTIHVLLSDVRMPDIDGLQLRDQILLERPEIHVLMMSQQLESFDEKIPILRKPFSPTVLLERIRQLLHSK